MTHRDDSSLLDEGGSGIFCNLWQISSFCSNIRWWNISLNIGWKIKNVVKISNYFDFFLFLSLDSSGEFKLYFLFYDFYTSNISPPSPLFKSSFPFIFELYFFNNFSLYMCIFMVSHFEIFRRILHFPYFLFESSIRICNSWPKIWKYFIHWFYFLQMM